MSQSFTVESVPNTKLVNNSYVSDPSQILHDTTVTRINRLLSGLEQNATAQVAVVMLPSIGSEEHVDFAQRLFNHWGIGQASNNNGLLILFILDQRTIRFHTGRGIEGVLPDATCKRIQQRYMVPYFKEGDYNTGMLKGIEATVNILLQPEAFEEILAEPTSIDSISGLYFLLLGVYVIVMVIAFVTRKLTKSSTIPEAIPITTTRWLVLNGLVPVLYFILAMAFELPFGVFLAGLYILLVTLFLERYARASTAAESIFKKRGQQDAYNFLSKQKSYWISAAVVSFIPMIFVYFKWRKTKNAYRNRPLACKTCGASMRRLSEAEEDAFMHSGQIAEENLRSVDYDIWRCEACGTVESLRYANNSTKFTPCPKCKYLTFHVVSRRTIKSATYTASGYGEEERSCRHCGHRLIKKYTIPMLVASSSDSSSSSSSSGGSWGGGSSGGGGASSSW